MSDVDEKLANQEKWLEQMRTGSVTAEVAVRVGLDAPRGEIVIDMGAPVSMLSFPLAVAKTLRDMLSQHIQELESQEPPDAVATMYRNFYAHCGVDWDDSWDCMCNDKCPVCDAEICPFKSVNLLTGDEITH